MAQGTRRLWDGEIARMGRWRAGNLEVAYCSSTGAVKPGEGDVWRDDRRGEDSSPDSRAIKNG